MIYKLGKFVINNIDILLNQKETSIHVNWLGDKMNRIDFSQ